MAGRSTFGNVRRLESGRWQARYLHEGKRFSAPQTFAAKADASAWLSTIEADLRRGAWIDPEAGAVTFAAYATAWLDQRHDLRPRTRDDYESLLKVHLLPAFGPLALVSITTSKVRIWHSTLAKTAPARAAKGYRLLRTILGTATTDRHIITNPCQVKGAGVEHSKERSLPTIAEVDALAAAMPERLALLVILAMWASLRRGELLALVRSDFDLLKGTVRIERAVVELANGTYLTGEPKTEAGRRTVYLPPHLLPSVQAHLVTYVAADPGALVFTNLAGGALSAHLLQHHWERARKAAGVGCHLHDLRHLGATLSATTGATTKEIMYRLGHASPQAALRYQHATEDRNATLAAALSELVPNAPVVPITAAH